MNTGQEAKDKEFYAKDPIFQRIQWELRRAYEEGWRDAGGDPERSPHDKPAVGWRKSWLTSASREFLVANGLISGEETWR